ncbi:MAG: hypothetical protein LBL49_04560 [Clostridiales Family XIII bacterium]|jgi:hypothetical protein|nr:hypothetical protein [Clostridiales Family XIII bacterium]
MKCDKCNKEWESDKHLSDSGISCPFCREPIGSGENSARLSAIEAPEHGNTTIDDELTNAVVYDESATLNMEDNLRKRRTMPMRRLLLDRGETEPESAEVQIIEDIKAHLNVATSVSKTSGDDSAENKDSATSEFKAANVSAGGDTKGSPKREDEKKKYSLSDNAVFDIFFILEMVSDVAAIFLSFIASKILVSGTSDTVAAELIGNLELPPQILSFLTKAFPPATALTMGIVIFVLRKLRKLYEKQAALQLAGDITNKKLRGEAYLVIGKSSLAGQDIPIGRTARRNTKKIELGWRYKVPLFINLLVLVGIPIYLAILATLPVGVIALIFVTVPGVASIGEVVRDRMAISKLPSEELKNLRRLELVRKLSKISEKAPEGKSA